MVVLAITVAGLLVFGAFGFGLPSSSQSSAKTIADGPTFYQTLASLNSSVANASGGPWALFSAYGIAAQLPFSPNLIGYVHTNVTVNACGQAFNGLTMWNGTIPLFDGTFDSGTAPFWQLAYFSNSSQEILVATDVLGDTHVFPAIPYPSSCMPWYDFPGNAANWTSPSEFPIVDSSLAARVAWDSVLQGSKTVSDLVPTYGPTTEVITIGPGVFLGFGDVVSAYGIYFDRCGEAGITGIQPLTLVGVGSSGQWIGTSNLTHNCALLYSGAGAYDSEYDLLFSTPSVSSGSLTASVTAEFQVAIALPNGTLENFFDEVGLANWMTSWNLTSPSGQDQPLATSLCSMWVPSAAQCRANYSGWYALIISAGGEWINSYGLSPNGTASWSVPVTALVSNQQLVIVCPGTWNISGYSVTPVSTVSVSHVIGSFTI